MQVEFQKTVKKIQLAQVHYKEHKSLSSGTNILMSVKTILSADNKIAPKIKKRIIFKVNINNNTFVKKAIKAGMAYS